ncbi:hypothetical protein ACLQ2C_36605 [Streptomyces sp. DT73]|uniref:hypothetical protein n=1 Tax=Streptomyces sp. DT73 TaxID=3393420 RepID=UPI003CEB2D3C
MTTTRQEKLMPDLAGPRVLARFSAADPRGSWPADDHAAKLTADGTAAVVVMHLDTDDFLVVTDTTT